MQAQSLDTFKHTLICAKAFTMPKLLACCEHHISLDSCQDFHPLSARLGNVLSPSSLTRIADSYQLAMQRMAAKLAPLRFSIEGNSCTPTCCQMERLIAAMMFGVINRSLVMSGNDIASAMLCQYMPSPKELLVMAEQLE